MEQALEPIPLPVNKACKSTRAVSTLVTALFTVRLYGAGIGTYSPACQQSM